MNWCRISSSHHMMYRTTILGQLNLYKPTFTSPHWHQLPKVRRACVSWWSWWCVSSTTIHACSPLWLLMFWGLSSNYFQLTMPHQDHQSQVTHAAHAHHALSYLAGASPRFEPMDESHLPDRTTQACSAFCDTLISHLLWVGWTTKWNSSRAVKNTPFSHLIVLVGWKRFPYYGL